MRRNPIPTLSRRIGGPLLLAAAMLCGTLFGASSCESAPSPEQAALLTAQVYYEQLRLGDYDAFVDGSLRGDTVPEAYRRQLVLNMQMYMEQQHRQHGGIDSIIPLRATADTARHTAEAFLAMVYADSTREVVVVPMAERGGVWYLR